MIELLIVIAVIGVLAVAVLSAINPIEQINKGRDTQGRSDAAELINAVDRYYASIGWYPWQTQPEEDNSQAWEEVSAVTDGTMTMLEKLVDTNEIKESYKNRVEAMAGTARELYAFLADLSGATMYSCFKPQSKAFQTEGQTACNGTPADDSPLTLEAGTTCPNDDTCRIGNQPTDCYICLP